MDSIRCVVLTRRQAKAELKVHIVMEAVQWRANGGRKVEIMAVEGGVAGLVHVAIDVRGAKMITACVRG